MKDLAQLPPEETIYGLTQAWVEEQGSLEATVTRTALATCLTRVLTFDPAANFRLDGPSLVSSFLALALSQRLAFDLGESLEAAATAWPIYQKALSRLEKELRDAISEIPDNPPGTGQWQGLAGWLFVTRILENVLQRFQDASAPS
jgi:hypothetical protein